MGVTSGRVNTNTISKSSFYVYWEQVSQSTPNNTTTINWVAGLYTGTSTSHDNFYNNAVKIYSVKINGTLVSNGGTWGYITTGGDHNLLSGSIDIPHNNDGTRSFVVEITAWTYSSSNYSGSDTFTLNDIPRYATIGTVQDFNDEQNPVMPYTNGAGNVVTSLQACISLDGSTDDIPFRDIPKTGTSYTFELTTAERNTLRNACTGKKRIVIFRIKTILGGVEYNSTGSCWMSIVNGNPTIEQITYSDVNATTTAVTHNDQKIVQGESSLQFQLYGINALKGATLSQLKVDINGNVQTTAYSGTSVASATYTYGDVDVSENINAKVTIVDSRGFETTYQVPLSIYEYNTPTAIIQIYREANYYSESVINVDADYSSLGGNNSITIQYRLKKTTEDDTHWSNWVTINDSTDTSFTADNQYAWDVEVYLVDAIGGHYTYSLSNALDIGIPLVFYDLKNRSVGINSIPTGATTFEINGKTILDLTYPIGSIYMSTSSTDPSLLFGGTWEAIQGKFLIGANSTYSAGSTGGNASHSHGLSAGYVKATYIWVENQNRWLMSRKSVGAYTANRYTTTGSPTYADGNWGGIGDGIELGGTTDSSSNLPPYLAVYMWKRIS